MVTNVSSDWFLLSVPGADLTFWKLKHLPFGTEIPRRNSKTTELYHSGRKEGNVLFNGALNTFYLQLYGIRHMVKDHSDSE